jgi:hypothetical protein
MDMSKCRCRGGDDYCAYCKCDPEPNVATDTLSGQDPPQPSAPDLCEQCGRPEYPERKHINSTCGKCRCVQCTLTAIEPTCTPPQPSVPDEMDACARCNCTRNGHQPRCCGIGGNCGCEAFVEQPSAPDLDALVEEAAHEAFNHFAMLSQTPMHEYGRESARRAIELYIEKQAELLRAEALSPTGTVTPPQPSAPDLDALVEECWAANRCNHDDYEWCELSCDELRAAFDKVDARARTTREQLAEAMNALPYIDPHDDEAWMVDTVWDKLKRLAGEE